MRTQATETELELAAQFARRREDISAAEWALNYFGVLSFGIESVCCGDGAIDYVNLGDTYTSTVIFDGSDYLVSSWGDWYESEETEYCQENDAIRCGYCGEFTPCAKEWHDTVCEHCGRFVDTGEKPELVASEEG